MSDDKKDPAWAKRALGEEMLRDAVDRKTVAVKAEADSWWACSPATRPSSRASVAVRPDETVRAEWEGAEAEEEPAEEEPAEEKPAEEEPAKEEVAKGHREYFRNLIEEINKRSDSGDGTTERSEAER